MTLWKISGDYQALNGDSGGDVEVYVFSPSSTSPPDAVAALQVARPKYRWTRIGRIQCLGELPPAWCTGDAGYLDEMVGEFEAPEMTRSV